MKAEACYFQGACQIIFWFNLKGRILLRRSWIQKALHMPVCTFSPLQAAAAPWCVQCRWEDDILKPSPVFQAAALPLPQPHPAHPSSLGNHWARKLLLPSWDPPTIMSVCCYLWYRSVVMTQTNPSLSFLLLARRKIQPTNKLICPMHQ